MRQRPLLTDAALPVIGAIGAVLVVVAFIVVPALVFAKWVALPALAIVLVVLFWLAFGEEPQ